MKKSFILAAFLAFSMLVWAQKEPFTPADALEVVSQSLREMTEDGRYLVMTSGTRKDRMKTDHKRYRDPSYVAPNFTNLMVLDTESGESWSIFGEKVILSGLKISPGQSTVAIMIYREPDWQIHLYDLGKRKLRQVKTKLKHDIASNSVLEWTADQSALLISLRDTGWQHKADSMYREATVGPRIVHDGSRPFLKWDEIGVFNSRNIPVLLDLATGSASELLPEGQYSGFRFARPGDRLIYTQTLPEKTSYSRRGGSKQALYSLRLDGEAVADTLLKLSADQASTYWNEEQTLFAYADSGKIMVRSIYDSLPVRIGIDTTEIVKKDTLKVKFSVMRMSPDQSKVLAASKTGWWLIDRVSNDMQRVYTLPEDEEKAPKRSIAAWSADGRSWYMTHSSPERWERGLVKYDLETQSFTDLIIDSGLYQGWRMSKDGKRFIYSYSDGDQPAEFFSCDESFSNPVRLTDSNPWIRDRLITRSELIKYLDSDGKELSGVLYYPVNYEVGKQYPMVCEIYETFFDNGFHPNMNILANEGFFGFRPSVNLIQGYPGEAWVKGITAGINQLIERGMVDPKKLGVHGTSYGGYAASLLITQTDRFAAAINISGKVNIISFLGDSEKIGTRNYSAAENGQDRIGQTVWEAPLKYIETTAVLHADRIKTPHLLLTGEGDWNVPGGNSRELYYALRRLGKEVQWVNYWNGGHGAGWASNEDDYLDQWERMIGWYKKYFK